MGYGDITPQNTVERFLACTFMLVGVFFYSFTIGSLSSLLSNLDSKNASYDQRLNTLLQIRNQYNIDVGLYNRVKKTLKYGQVQNADKKIKFLNDLPLNLRVELSVTMHRNILSGFCLNSFLINLTIYLYAYNLKQNKKLLQCSFIYVFK